jgi:hypothetical protein
LHAALLCGPGFASKTSGASCTHSTSRNAPGPILPSSSALFPSHLQTRPTPNISPDLGPLDMALLSHPTGPLPAAEPLRTR